MDHDLDIARMIDHALLNPAATTEEVKRCCNEAWQHNFPTVCVYPSAVRDATEFLHGKAPQVCTVIGFPTGATTTATKCYEAAEAVENGATELDVVINLGWLKGGSPERVNREIAEICEETGVVIKAIIETGLLTQQEKQLAVEVCLDAGVTFIKTNTGWFGGATVADVELIREITRGQVGIKASGGIRTLENAIALIDAGANRLGTSRGLQLIQQQEKISYREDADT
ncbi:MAG: deoxyribose-phosphate aldolase [Cyanobacteria bacterium]|jgi:deoxyribose-phosphate aldolase|nr:deoxyribose-phosphate aldolase [Cyanobacteria bacterium GSL.Bin1]